MLIPYPVVLASASPRRRELLSRLLPTFTVEPADVDEDSLTVSDPWKTAEALALTKAKSVFAERSVDLIIGGDTVVAIEGEGQLAKPSSAEDAVRMLTLLSGRTHLVITGIALVWPEGQASFTDTSRVTFRPLSLSEIQAYVATGEPMDKAGAYAIQGGAAGFVDHLDGSMSNVIGLPLEALEQRLREIFG